MAAKRQAVSGQRLRAAGGVAADGDRAGCARRCSSGLGRRRCATARADGNGIERSCLAQQAKRYTALAKGICLRADSRCQIASLAHETKSAAVVTANLRAGAEQCHGKLTVSVRAATRHQGSIAAAVGKSSAEHGAIQAGEGQADIAVAAARNNRAGVSRQRQRQQQRHDRHSQAASASLGVMQRAAVARRKGAAHPARSGALAFGGNQFRDRDPGPQDLAIYGAVNIIHSWLDTK